MSATGHKIHLAMGIFYEAERLEAAARALLELGRGERRICALVQGARAAALAQLADFAVGAPEELARPFAGLVLIHLQPARPNDRDNAADCLIELMDGGGPGLDITRHLSRGACVLISRTADAALHDQCMRTLLRLSHHTVHSQEFEARAMQGCEPAPMRDAAEPCE